MRTKWDYTSLANAYLKRPSYSDKAIADLITLTRVGRQSNICDVGAGVAHLTLLLAGTQANIVAIEPNDAMRLNGINRTCDYPNVSWCEGTGENTKQDDDSFDLVTFGSSFNVTDRCEALKETSRILRPKGWFACLWNHRDLKDPIQEQIESIIQAYIPEYDYGTRRQDQTSIIQESGLFGEVKKICGKIYHKQSISDCLEAWQSHATLKRQAGEQFNLIISEIEQFLSKQPSNYIMIPYTTNVWISQALKR